MTAPSYLKLDLRSETGVAIVQLNRPEKRNAFNHAMMRELVGVLDTLEGDVEIRVIVLSGLPDGPFCSGMDIKELSQLTTDEARRISFLKNLNDAFERSTKPIIAAVIGHAVGGGFEIALASDMIYASHDATFGLPEIKIGTMPGAGGTQRLTRALGKHKAMELILTGDTISGKELERFGLVNKTFEKRQVLGEAIQLAERIAEMGREVVRRGREGVLAADAMHLADGMAREKELYYQTFGLGDFEEGVGAFLEKRAPKFKHK
ncbi:enoyl-CoA hydratase/isomerase [Cercophora scortea]|uniref:Enoyl-CoA hydratase/isomerase n=1 Tax=Cercophora scortea TaxID=314031 RepID=A0AAE0MHQ6_9PEZI|nr:enoyl-CoA hydratase/isomerase [Cercophora scortea]